jgi:hypothetical protein
MATPNPRRYPKKTGAFQRQRGCAVRQIQDTILQRLGKALHGHGDDITHEPLPRRWVDLIHHLDEQERRRSQGRQSKPERQQNLPKPARKARI